MRLRILHKTRYHYAAPASYALQQIRLTPKSRPDHQVISWDVELNGAKREAEFEDQNSNSVTLTSILPDAQEIEIVCRGEVETSNGSGVIGRHAGYAPLWYFRRHTSLTRPEAFAQELIAELGDAGGDEVGRMHRLSALIAERVEYETGVTDAETTAQQAYEKQKGVCQDHAHIMISVARSMGYPARYVGGYLMMMDRVEQNAGHAWAEIYIDPLGWVGFDISNGISPDERYVRVATGLDYTAAAPISGLIISGDANAGKAQLSVDIEVQQQ